MMLSKQIIAGLFKDWKKLFKTKMKDEDWQMDTINIWHLVLNDLEITPDEFLVAQRKSFSLSWIPTAPADFLALAREDKMLIFPDAYDAYVQAANDKYPHPVVFETANRFGLRQLRSEASKTGFPKFRSIYSTVCRDYAQNRLEIDQNMAKIQQKKENDMKVLEHSKMSLEEQFDIANAALNKFRGL